MDTYGVIMAGGGGTRFWPLSTRKRPKQFLNLSGEDILLNETLDRQQGLVEAENLFVVTAADQADAVYRLTGNRLRPGRVLAEPAARNTAACIGYAAMEVLRKYGDGVMCIFPADHHISDRAAYLRVMKKAVQAAREEEALVTIGVRPTSPATGYGYICHSAIPGREWRTVERFVEKPDADAARSYVESGNYAWNSGMFVWKASVILRWMERLLPALYQGLARIGEAMGTAQEGEVLREVYPTLQKISVDYGIMEQADRVLMLEGDFGWSDVGSWDGLDSVKRRDGQGNLTEGRTLLLDSHGCVAYGTDKLVATVGVEDLVIVEAERAVLVCPVSQAQRVKEIVSALEERGLEEYL